MFTQIILICLLGQIATTVYEEDNVVIDMVRPRSKSLDAHNQQIRDFWTPEKLKAAKSLDVILPDLASKSAANAVNYTAGPVSSVPGSLPVNNGTLSRIIASNGNQVRTTGRIFWQVGSGSYSCSGSVVTSVTGDLISTAGHCIFDTATRRWFNNNNWVFVPAYSNGNAPYGIWPARNFIASTGWTASANYNYDAAFVAVSTISCRHIQSVVGAQGIGFNFPRLAYMYSFGYPSNLDSGLYLKSCNGYAQNSRYTAYNFIGQGLPCNMGQGCSGGPWLQNVVETTGLGYITSVNSFLVTSIPNVMNGPYFDTNIKSIYDQAKYM